jgi:hypothetical protein
MSLDVAGKRNRHLMHTLIRDMDTGQTIDRAVCRIVHERRIDAYGREIIHRIRICDEGPIYPTPYRTMVPPEYGYPPRPYYEPFPSRYYSYPRPPAPIEGYYN